MRTFDALATEHALMKRLLGVLDDTTRRVAGDAQFSRDTLGTVLDALEHLETIHVAKEEQVLFPYLETRGLSRATAVVNALSTQHQLVRRHGEELRRLSRRFSAGDNSVAAELSSAVREFTNLFREHMRIEDVYFYDLAGKTMPAEDEQRILTRFDGIDRVGQAETARSTAEALIVKVQQALSADGHERPD